MAIKTTLTENELKTFMFAVLGKTATKLGWSIGNNDFDEPVNEVLYALGASDFTFVSTQSDVSKCRTIARVEVWRAAMYYTAHEATHSVGAPGTGQTSRGEIHRHCQEMFQLAQSELNSKYPELAPETGGWAVDRVPVKYDNDVYSNAGETA